MNDKKRKNSGSKTLGKVIRYVGTYSPLITVSLFCGAVSALLTLYIPKLIGRALDCMIGAGEVDLTRVRELLITGAICVAASSLCSWVMNVINNRITYGVTKDVRTDAFKKLQTIPFSYTDTHPTGETVSRIISDADQFADGLLLGSSKLFTGVLTIAGTLVFMVSISPPIAVTVVVLTPISLFVAAFIASRTHSLFRRRSVLNAEQTAFIDEAIVGQKVIAAFGHQDKKQEEFDEINERLAKCSVSAVFFSALTNPCTRFVNSLVYAAVALTGALSVIGAAGPFFTPITVGGLATLLSYANQYTKPFNEISGVITELQNSLACAERIFELIEEPSEVPDAPDARVITSPDGRVTLDGVSFSYVPDRPLIRDLSLEVAGGKKIAIVGPTGCGKTTLINLLMRFYDVTGGGIRVGFTDGNGDSGTADLRDVTRSSLRRSYGMVLQETWLRRGTIRDNILIGKPDATEEEMIAAAKASHAHSFIRRLPDGYDTFIGEDGGNLSQGQKQLLCITRVMLRRPPMLILDEATSSIDTRTEQKIQAAFEELMKGRTSFIVAHRLSTIRSADVILVMKDGNVIEKGTHESLMAKNGFYAGLYAAGSAKAAARA